MKDINEFALELSANFLKSSEFFLRYLIQLTFLTNIVQILDIPHYLYMGMKRFFSKEFYEDEVEDDWYFDIAYHYAFAISVFIIVLVFSASVPFIPLFGFLFFTFKVSSLMILFNCSTLLTSIILCLCILRSSSLEVSWQAVLPSTQLSGYFFSSCLCADFLLLFLGKISLLLR